MKKTLVIAVVLTMALAAVANAYTIQAVASNPTGGNSTPTIYMTTGLSGTPQTLSSVTGDAILLYIYGPAYGYADAYYGNVKQLEEPEAWVMKLTTSASYAYDTVRLRMSTPSTDANPAQGYVLTFNGEEVWNGKFFGDDGPIDILLSTSSIGDSATLKFAAVPEPGSIIALASGFIGLAGFGIRRKK